jgi:hypothetical protein
MVGGRGHATQAALLARRDVDHRVAASPDPNRHRDRRARPDHQGNLGGPAVAPERRIAVPGRSLGGQGRGHQGSTPARRPGPAAAGWPAPGGRVAGPGLQAARDHQRVAGAAGRDGQAGGRPGGSQAGPASPALAAPCAHPARVAPASATATETASTGGQRPMTDVSRGGQPGARPAHQLGGNPATISPEPDMAGQRHIRREAAFRRAGAALGHLAGFAGGGHGAAGAGTRPYCRQQPARAACPNSRRRLPTPELTLWGPGVRPDPLSCSAR